VTAPLIIKFGGDALATPNRIAAAARVIEQRLASGPVVAVASARRGVTDHLLSLVDQVRADAGPHTKRQTLAASADRAIAAGELVSASLLALALGRLGIPAEVLDAREAGLLSDGHWSRAQIIQVRPGRILKLLARGVTPVVTGFQGWYRGRITTLGRGGSDTTAVALTQALGGIRCELVKHRGGILTADPKVVPEARLISHASHQFVTALATAGAKVIAARAALLAEQHAIPLHFSSVEDGDVSIVESTADSGESCAIASRSGRYRLKARLGSPPPQDSRTVLSRGVELAGLPLEWEITADAAGASLEVLTDPADLDACLELARPLLPKGRQLSLLDAGLTTVTVIGPSHRQRSLLHNAARTMEARLLATSRTIARVSFLVPDAAGPTLVRTLHSALWDSDPGSTNLDDNDEATLMRREHVGQR
jgi:aspartate kinase